MWSFNDTQSCTPQYVCEKCMWESINKEKAEYQKKYDKALKYLKDNNYKVVVTGYGYYKEVFEIKDDVMECVDIIRERMKQQGFHETWIDVDWETYEGCEIEIVSYLFFEKYDEIKVDEYGYYTKVEEEKAFWFELSNNLKGDINA